MPSGRATFLLVVVVVAASVVACRSEPTPSPAPLDAEAVSRVRRELARRKQAAAAASGSAAPSLARAPSPPTAPAPAPSNAPLLTGDGGPAEMLPARRPLLGSAPWIVDDPVHLGPPGQATATPAGVLWNDHDGELILAPLLGRLPSTPGPSKAPLRALASGTWKLGLGRGPTLGDGFVYWISHGSLVRRRFRPPEPPGSLEILARDALDGTRVGVPSGSTGEPAAKGRARAAPRKIPETAAYIVRPPKEDAPLVAKLWIEGTPAELLTAEGNSTHSVSLVRTDDGVLAVSVQARMAMTPVHARAVHFGAAAPVLGDDVVVWVGGGIQPLTEMTMLRTGTSGLLGFLPHERSMTEFGIARLDVGMTPSMDTKATWLLYPNGIDPAPVAAAHLCGEPVVLYAAPEVAAPDSPQELLLTSLDDPSGSRIQRIASDRAFYFASVSEVEGGALVVWVTREGTTATTVRCTTRPK